MKSIDSKKVTNKQSDKTHILFRFGSITIFEYYSDKSKGEWKVLIFNRGWKND